MNDAIQTMLDRHTTRSFLPDAVSKDDLKTIMDCARWAPSGSNQQPWHFQVITKKEVIDGIARIVADRYASFVDSIPDEIARAHITAYGKYLSFIDTAPVVVAVSGKPYVSYFNKVLTKYGLENPFKPHDVHPAALSIGAAIENMLIAAQSLDYGSCWMSGPMLFQSELEKYLDIQEPWHLVSLVLIGKQAGDTAQRSRLSLADICEFDYET